MANKKIKVLIDSDVANEIDDQFAICYALSCRDKLDVKGITIEPFRVSWKHTLSVKESLVESRNEVNRILHLFGIVRTQKNPFVYLGCEGFVSEDYNSSNPAVEKIIQLSKKYEDLVVCCLGTLTNLAMAIKLAPEIADRLNIVWLGTDHPFLEVFDDSNFRKDKKAFEIVLNSKAKFTILPSYLARQIVMSDADFLNNLSANNVTKYLHSLLKNFYFAKENLGFKSIYDIAPVDYLLNPEQYIVKSIPAKQIFKYQKFKVASDRQINYVCAFPKYFQIWKNFFKSLNDEKNLYLKPNLFFTSDTHFNHERKVKLKQVPFKTVEEMNAELVRRWNNVVSSGDTVYHLGDFGKYEFVKNLNGKIILVCGNYEKADIKKDFNGDFNLFREKLIELGFADVVKEGLYLDEKIFGRKVYLTHKPTDHAKACLSLFGHVHTLKLVEKYGFNVCCTYHYFTPLSQKTVKNYLDFVDKFADEDVFY